MREIDHGLDAEGLHYIRGYDAADAAGLGAAPLADVFGPETGDERAAGVGGAAFGVRRRGFGEAVDADRQAVGVFGETAADEIHGRRADETRDEARARVIVERAGRADLLDKPVAHDDDAIGEGHRLDLVVRDVDGGGAQALVKSLDFRAHLAAQLGVEIGQRLVEQEDARVAHDGAAHRDALALAAGQLPRAALEQFADAQDVGRRRDAALDLALCVFAQAQAERHVLRHGHVGVERIVLEDHGDVAVFRRDIVDAFAADADLARCDVFQPGDHAQCGALAAARGADEHDEFVVGYVEVDAAHGLGAVEGLAQGAERNVGHLLTPWWRRMSGRRCSSP